MTAGIRSLFLLCLLGLAGCYDTTGAPDVLTAKQALDAAPLLTEAEYAAALAAQEGQGDPTNLASPALGAQMLLPVPLACEDVPQIAPGVKEVRLIAVFAVAPPTFEEVRLLRDAQSQTATCLAARGIAARYGTRMGLDGSELRSDRPLALVLEIPAEN